MLSVGSVVDSHNSCSYCIQLLLRVFRRVDWFGIVSMVIIAIET